MKNKNEIHSLMNEIASCKINKIILSNLVDKKEGEYIRTEIERILLRGREGFQISGYTQKQVFHENIEESELIERVMSLLLFYKQVNIFTDSTSEEIRFNRKRDFIHNKKIISNNMGKMMPRQNNRKKEYILKEGDNIPVFQELGIFTSEYKIVNSKYDKFKQINRFTEILEDVLKDFKRDSINIIDFGCGKSYLTFVVYYYLTEIKKIKANIVGLDLKREVIEKCNEISKKYDYKNLSFEVGDINGYKAPFEVDLVITLHACDTATDYALYNAINWGADMILSVPCCQHELNKQISSETFAILTRYGIVKERVSALMTDAIRASLLEWQGYKSELLEFIDIEHSPKNILIRAKRRNISKEKRETALNEVNRMCDEFNLKPCLLGLLEEKN